jgi:hypothetical protein
MHKLWRSTYFSPARYFLIFPSSDYLSQNYVSRLSVRVYIQTAACSFTLQYPSKFMYYRWRYTHSGGRFTRPDYLLSPLRCSWFFSLCTAECRPRLSPSKFLTTQRSWSSSDLDRQYLTSAAETVRINPFCLFVTPVFHVTELGYLLKNLLQFKEFCLLGCNAVWSVESQPAFRRNMPSFSRSKNKRSKKPAWSKWQAEQAHRRYIPENRTLHNRRCENLRFCLLQFLIIRYNSDLVYGQETFYFLL